MSDDEEMIKITFEDIEGANQLSLHCPICAGAVYKDADSAELMPVMCGDCSTLYHRVCWQNNGGKCAILGCNSTKWRPYGAVEPSLTIHMNDLPTEVEVNRRNKRLKQIEQTKRRLSNTSSNNRRPRVAPAPPPPSPGFWSDLFANIRRIFGRSS